MAVSRVQAWEQLHDTEYSGNLSMAAFYDLMIRAGYSEESAQKAANKRGYERLQAGVMM